MKIITKFIYVFVVFGAVVSSLGSSSAQALTGCATQDPNSFGWQRDTFYTSGRQVKVIIYLTQGGLFSNILM
jgi:hypothetical protein